MWIDAISLGRQEPLELALVACKLPQLFVRERRARAVLGLLLTLLELLQGALETAYFTVRPVTDANSSTPFLEGRGAHAKLLGRDFERQVEVATERDKVARGDRKRRRERSVQRRHGRVVRRAFLEIVRDHLHAQGPLRLVCCGRLEGHVHVPRVRGCRCRG